MRKTITISKSFLWITVLSCSPALGETTITLQQGLNGYTGTTDAWLEEANEQNYGTDQTLHIQYNSGISDATVVRFELAGQIPPYQRVLSARLYFWYLSAGSMGRTNAIELKPYRILPEKWWDEGDGTDHHGVNWKYRDYYQTLPWTSQYGSWYDKIDDGNSTIWIQDTDGEVGGNPPPTRPSNWIDFNVVNTVRQWYQQGQTNTGFDLFSINFVGSGYIAHGVFSSRNYSIQGYRPKLVITYEGALLPVADAGGPYTVGPGQSVIFDGSGSYDPDGGNITAWLWDLDNDGAYDDASGMLVPKTYAELIALGLTPGDHVISLIVQDNEGEWSDPDTALLRILPELDFGDAPAPYPTLLLNSGARHVIVPGVYLGWSIDGEPDGLPDPAALGDDNGGIDDEDGVTFTPPLTPGTWANVDVTASVGGFLSAWIDFSRNNSWGDPDDRIFNGWWIPAGTHTLTFYVPVAASPGVSFARFRFTTQGALGYTGEALDGEVEDHTIMIGEAPPRHDLGDAPDSTNHFGVAMSAYPDVGVQANFPTTYQSTTASPLGPLHLQPRAAFLGMQVSLENEADTGPDEDGMNNLDPPSDAADRDGADDGVAVPLYLPHCQETTFSYVITIVNIPAETLYVNAWFDWNRDGDWDDVEVCPLNVLAPEWAVQNQAIAVPSPGQYTFATPPFYSWHPSEPASSIWMRITLSERPWTPSPQPGHGGSGPDGGYQFGETEDYIFVPVVSQACCLPGGQCEDLDPQACANAGGATQGPGTQCTQTLEACCMPDGSCVMVDPICCDDVGGIPQGAGSVCTEPEACCIPDGICVMADPLCCDDLGGVAQGKGTACVDMTIACCLPSGDCVEVDPLCCDDLGGTPGYMPHCLGDHNGNGTDDACEVEPKWLQPTHPGGLGFDAASDLSWPEPPKWDQGPDYDWPGLPAHDYEVGPMIARITLADDWICQGGDIIALQWWGNYELDTAGQELRGAGINHFHLSIHLCAGGVPWCLPMEPELVGFDLPFAVSLEQPTGQVNIEGSPVYFYEFRLPAPFPQQQGTHYWFDVTAVSNDPAAPPHWRWQEASRSFQYLGWAPAAEKVEPPFPGTWQSIVWPTDQFSDMAFRVVSGHAPTQTVNKVVADDFISDGRPIKALDWFGSYFDERYSPLHPPMEPYVLDGWLISFHYDAPPAVCPPDLAAGDVPSVLGVYYAPVDAVEIQGLFMADCFGHGVFAYSVDLRACCLLCSRPDPRLPFGIPPAQSDGFHEVAGLRYWISIQAVVGVTWQPPDCGYEDRELTGHLPSPQTPDGHFWGWHTSPADFMPKGPLNEACTGRIVDFSPYPPDCWDYGQWVKQPWLCDTMPPFPEVNMAFTLLAPICHPRGDVNNDANLDIYDIPGFVDCLVQEVAMGYWCGCADMNHDYLTNGLDIQLFVDAILAP